MRESSLIQKVCYSASRKTFFYCKITLLILLGGLIQLNSTYVYAQKNVSEEKDKGGTITGNVRDVNGEPIIGASILVKGTTAGTTTNLDGYYTLSNVASNAVLIISYIGMNTQEVHIKGKDLINVTLEDASIGIDEVVVVGYGTQKKVNLTGAVSAVKVDEQLVSRSLTSTSLALQGKVPGLSITQNSGMAGRNDVKMLVRGMGTVNNADPLVVVDGMPDVDIDRINIDDIESVSVLKDASSSAIYGSRAANGVILITTKSGHESAPKINASASYTIGTPTHAWEFMADYPRSLTLLQRDAAVSTLPGNIRFKDGTIDQWMALGMIDPVRYPNTDWYDVILRNSQVQKYNLSASGGNKVSNFYISLGVIDEKGLLINNDYTRYNLRVNYDAKIRSNMHVGVKIAGNWSDLQYALTSNFDGTIDANEMRYAIAGVTPYDPITGYYGGVMAYGEDPQIFNPYSAYNTQLTQKERQELNGNVYWDWSPVKGLTARLDYSLNYGNDFRYQADTPNRAYNFQTNDFGARYFVEDNAPIYNYTNNSYKTQFSARLNYDITFCKHHTLNAMFAFSEEYWHTRYQMSGRNDRLHSSLHEIDAALTEKQYTGGNSSAEGLVSYIGRINYAAYQRYLFEFNLRCDGSSKFLDGSKYGYFPSASVGWIFSEEPFINKYVKGWLNHAKLRVSYGVLGNNSGVGRYEQQETLATNNYMIDGKILKGYVNKKMVNPDLSWEETSVTNIGLDMKFFNNRLSVELDYYDRLTSGMIRPSDMSVHLTGAYSAPRKNIGELRNKGVEANIVWRGRVNEFNYTVNANASYNATVLEKWNEYLGRNQKNSNDYVFINMPYNYVYAYEAIGIAQSWNDVYNATPQGAQPGDLLYKDLNGDGKIDDNDMKAFPRIQRDRPTTNFALSGNFEWKGFDLSIMFQGAAGRKTFWLTANNNPDLQEARQATTWDHWTKPWSLENRGGEWTRLGGANNRKESTFWLDNLAYLRLKNLQLGYTIPQNRLKKIGLSSIRMYVSADNLATITKFRGLDPEKEGNINDGYPLVKSFTFGINVGI